MTSVLRLSLIVPTALITMLPRSSAAVEQYAKVVEENGRAVVVTASGRRVVQKNESEQTGASAGAVSPDGTSVGWLALYPYASASYSIPMKLVILTNGRRRVLTSTVGLPIWYWSFQDGGKRVAFHSETTHGGLGESYELRDVASGRVIAKYAPEYDENGRVASRSNEPNWVKELEAARQREP